ncbi:MAG: GGDEF domain-containing protein [bacterium]|nr:GGDEF domain-containing protein [bacterium]
MSQSIPSQAPSHDLSTPRKETLKKWKETLILCFLLTGLAFLIEWVLGNGVLNSYGKHPHPYWLLPLPLAASRGLIAGLTGATMASALYALSALISGTLSEMVELFDRAVLQEALLFVGVAILVGELRDRIQEKLAASKERIALLEQSESRLSREVTTLESIQRELERRVANTDQDFSEIIHMAHRMRFADRKDLFVIAVELTLQQCADSTVVYSVLEGGELQEEAQRRQPGARVLPLSKIALSGLVRRAIQEGSLQNSLQTAGARSGVGPLFVAPLFDHHRRVAALLTVHDLAPERVRSSTPRTFAAIAHWVSSGIGHLAMGTPFSPQERASDSSSLDWDHPPCVGPAAVLPDRLKVEWERHESSQIPLTILSLQLPEELPVEPGEALDEALLNAISKGLRAADGIYRFCYDNAFAIVLPGTGVEGASVVEARLMRLLENLGSVAGVHSRISSFGPGHGQGDPEDVLSEIASCFREESKKPLGLAEWPPADTVLLGDDVDLERWIIRERSMTTRYGFQFHLYQLDRLEGCQGVRHALGRRIGSEGFDHPEIFQLQADGWVLAFAGKAPGLGSELGAVQVWVDHRLGGGTAKVTPYSAKLELEGSGV